MIVTQNSMYLHVPKTAGIWCKDVLAPITLTWEIHKRPSTKPVEKYVYAFVRNPWDWHVSMYHFLKNGSNEFNSFFTNGFLINGLPNDKSFNDFVRMATAPTDEYKKLQFNLERVNLKLGRSHENRYHYYKTWIDVDVGMYQCLCDLYTEHTTRVGHYENLVNDLLSMLTESGDMSEAMAQRVSSMPPVNVTRNRTDYRSYYTPETAQMVYDSCKRLITEHNYEF